MTFLTKFEFEFSRPFSFCCWDSRMQSQLKLYTTFWQKTEWTLPETESVPDIFSASPPVWLGRLRPLCQFWTINCESAENIWSVFFYFLSRKDALLASNLPRIWSEKSLSEWRAEIIGLQFYQGCNHQEYQQEIHFAFPWALESKAHHLTLKVMCEFTKQVSFYEKSMLLKSMPFSSDSIRYVS